MSEKKTPLEQAIVEHAENKAIGQKVVESLEQTRAKLTARIAKMRGKRRPSLRIVRAK